MLNFYHFYLIIREVRVPGIAKKHQDRPKLFQYDDIPKNSPCSCTKIKTHEKRLVVERGQLLQRRMKMFFKGQREVDSPISVILSQLGPLQLLGNRMMRLSYPRSKKRQKHYDKLQAREKWILLRRTLIDLDQLKQTAHEMRVNYSTAKTFMRKYYRYGYEIDEAFVKSICAWYEVYASDRQHQLNRCHYSSIEPSSEGDSGGDDQGILVKQEQKSDRQEPQEGNRSIAGSTQRSVPKENSEAGSRKEKGQQIELRQMVLFDR